MAGLLGQGANLRGEALGLIDKSAQLHSRRQEEEKMRKAAKMQNIGSSVGTGAAIGSTGGPWGMAIGAGIGLMAGILTS